MVHRDKILTISGLLSRIPLLRFCRLNIYLFMITRFQQRQIFEHEVQRLSHIEIPDFETTIFSSDTTVYRPIFASNMEQQFLSTLAKEQVKSLTKFSGADSEDVIQWLKNVDEVFDRALLQPENKYLAIQSYLVDAALKWFRFNKLNIPDWVSFKIAIIKAYQFSIHETLVKMEQRRQLPGESVMTYYHDKLYLCTQADPNMCSSMVIHYLTKGLNGSIMPHVIRRHPTTSNDFLTFAQDEEKILVTLNGLSHVSTHPSRSATDPYTIDDNPADDMVAFVKQSGNKNNRSVNVPRHGKSPQPQPLMNLPFGQIQSSSTGHYYPSPTPATSVSRQCYECRRFGHIARFCPNRKNM